MASIQPGVRTHGRPAHRDQPHSRFRQDARRISSAVGGGIAQPPRPGGQTRRTPQSPRARGGGQVVQPRGSHLNAHGPAIRSADEMHTPSEELLPFGGAFPTEGAPAHVPTAPGARPAARRQGKAVDDEPVARGDAPPTFAGIQTIPSAS